MVIFKSCVRDIRHLVKHSLSAVLAVGLFEYIHVYVNCYLFMGSFSVNLIASLRLPDIIQSFPVILLPPLHLFIPLHLLIVLLLFPLILLLFLYFFVFYIIVSTIIGMCYYAISPSSPIPSYFFSRLFFVFTSSSFLPVLRLHHHHHVIIQLDCKDVPWDMDRLSTSQYSNITKNRPFIWCRPISVLLRLRVALFVLDHLYKY